MVVGGRVGARRSVSVRGHCCVVNCRRQRLVLVVCALAKRATKARCALEPLEHCSSGGRGTTWLYVYAYNRVAAKNGSVTFQI